MTEKPTQLVIFVVVVSGEEGIDSSDWIVLAATNGTTFALLFEFCFIPFKRHAKRAHEIVGQSCDFTDGHISSMLDSEEFRLGMKPTMSATPGKSQHRLLENELFGKPILLKPESAPSLIRLWDRHAVSLIPD